MKELAKETPEAKSWIYGTLSQAGIRLPTVEGYSVRETRVTALFERLKSTVPVEDWSESEVNSWLQTNENKEDWVDRVLLASALKVSLLLVLWENGVNKFRLLSVSADNGNMKARKEIDFYSCKKLALWMSNLKGIKVSKTFIEPGRLSSIDECLRSYGVPWPGNLDGFIYDRNAAKVRVIFELSRTRKFPVETHDLNRFFSQDVNRWKVLGILARQLNAPLYILIWSNHEDIVKIHKVAEITDKILNFEKTEIIKSGQIVQYFEQRRLKT